MSGIDSDLIRGHIDTIILKTLFDGDKYGYEILDEVAKKSDGAYELKQPTLYSCLKRLENQGLISSYWVDSEIGGKRHYYCLTEQGKETYIENQKNWLRSRQIIDNLIWEDAPTLPNKEIITERPELNNDENQDNNNEPANVVDYIPPVSNKNNNEEEQQEGLLLADLINESENEQVDDIVVEEKLEEQKTDEMQESINLVSDIDEEENTDNIVENSEETSDSFDIMELLGHYDNTQTTETEIEKLNEVTETLNTLQDEYSGNSFMENFVKNYMTEEETPKSFTDDEKEKTEEEYEDNFNLDLSQYLTNDDSYFSSVDENNKKLESPDIVIDNLKKTQEDNHIEILDEKSDDDQIYTQETIEETTVEDSITPTYVSFGEEIPRNTYIEEDTAYSYLEEKTSDYDSLYSPYEEEKTETIENETTTYISDINEETQQEFDETNEITPQIDEYQLNQNDYYETVVDINQVQNNETRDVIQAGFTDDASKQKITELTTFAKESSVNDNEKIIEEILFDTDNFLERNKVIKNYDKLIADFEKEGLNVRVHKKMVKEAKDKRTYVQTNKIKMTRNWISFCFIAAILAVCFAVMQSSGVDYYDFSYKLFVFGILIALIIPIISTIIFAINPYKKHVAGFSPSVSFMLSGLVFVQLLLIIYCVNLQLGFYSFSQEFYNHLYWIIPSIIAIYPILNSIVYTTLYKSKNFHS